MCRVITPEDGHHHAHPTSDPLEIAELLRDALSTELDTMSDMAAKWALIEDPAARHALLHAIEEKRRAMQHIWDAIAAAEEAGFAHEPHHHHDHNHDHKH